MSGSATDEYRGRWRFLHAVAAALEFQLGCVAARAAVFPESFEPRLQILVRGAVVGQADSGTFFVQAELADNFDFNINAEEFTLRLWEGIQMGKHEMTPYNRLNELPRLPVNILRN